MFAVTILGNNSAIPAYGRMPTAQVVTLNDQQFLIDCGEGTQMQLAKYKIRKSKINHIFISHLHGDHYFGLIGLITSMGLLNRENDLHIYAPAGIEQIIQLQLQVANITLPFSLYFHVLHTEGILINENKFSVECFTVQHSIECWGFIFREKKAPRKIDKEKAVQYQIPAAFYNQLKEGLDYVTKEGLIISNNDVTTTNTPARSYAYCADTKYFEELIPKVKDVNVLYHETTYLKNFEEKAILRFHSTTHQAANIAKQCNAHKLLIGHFSSKYENLDQFLTEAKEVFKSTELAIEGVCYNVL